MERVLTYILDKKAGSNKAVEAHGLIAQVAASGAALDCSRRYQPDVGGKPSTCFVKRIILGFLLESMHLTQTPDRTEPGYKQPESADAMNY